MDNLVANLDAALRPYRGTRKLKYLFLNGLMLCICNFLASNCIMKRTILCVYVCGIILYLEGKSRQRDGAFLLLTLTSVSQKLWS